jgi:hypothetical protein
MSLRFTTSFVIAGLEGGDGMFVNTLEALRGIEAWLIKRFGPRMGLLSRQSNAAFQRITIDGDGKTHVLLFGQTAYGKGAAPKAGHKPDTIIEMR